MMSPLPSAGEHRTRCMTGAQGVTRRPQPPSHTNDGHPARDGRLAYVGFYESNPNTWCGEYQETSCNSEEQLLTTEVAVTHHLYRILRIAASYDRCDLLPCEPSQEAQPEDQARLVIVDALNERHDLPLTSSSRKPTRASISTISAARSPTLSFMPGVCGIPVRAAAPGQAASRKDCSISLALASFSISSKC